MLYTAISIIILTIINQVLGEIYQKKKLIFLHDHRIIYTTKEFNWIVNTNNLGLRGKDLKLKKDRKTTRILCLGDSWTYGWGVNDNETWPSVLEKILREKNYNVEVINAGIPGATPMHYEKYQEYLVPILQPDIVIIGILQFEDYQQIHDQLIRDSLKIESKEIYLQRNYLDTRIYVNNILLLIDDIVRKESITIATSDWAENFNTLYQNLSEEKKSQFSSIFSDSIKLMLKSGNLNPGIVERVFYGNLLNNDKSIEKLKMKIHEIFAKFKNTSIKYDTKLLIVKQPMAPFVGHKNAISNMLLSNFKNEDSIFSKIAAENDVAFLDLSDNFKKLNDRTKYFFVYDGHPTSYGYDVIATNIESYLIENQLLNINK